MKRAFVLAALVAAVPLAAPAETVADAVRPQSVTVTRAERGEITETANVTGTLVPREEILVSPQIDGVAVTAILAEEGDTVTAGQVLARLSREALDAMLAQNTAQIARDQAAIAEAEAARVEADAAFARAHDLVRTATASRETYDTRQAAALTAAARVASARADLAFAQAQRQELQVKLVHTDITAPVAGVVSRRVARLGSVVMMNGDPLFRIISNGRIELQADVPETVLARLRPGQQDGDGGGCCTHRHDPAGVAGDECGLAAGAHPHRDRSGGGWMAGAGAGRVRPRGDPHGAPYRRAGGLVGRAVRGGRRACAGGAQRCGGNAHRSAGAKGRRARGNFGRACGGGGGGGRFGHVCARG